MLAAADVIEPVKLVEEVVGKLFFRESLWNNYLDFNLLEPVVDAPPIGEAIKSTEENTGN